MKAEKTVHSYLKRAKKMLTTELGGNRIGITEGGHKINYGPLFTREELTMRALMLQLSELKETHE